LYKKLDLYFHTLRYLRPVQIYGRIWFNFKRVRPKVAAAPPLRRQDSPWIPVARREASLLSQREFSFLNQRGLLDEVGWDGPQREKLWRYNQHYFDDLNAREADQRLTWHELLVEDWLSQNPPGHGVGWDPYPTSLRIVNWIKWSLGGGRLSPASMQSLAIQARWLSQKLEFHLLGNHLFANAKALVFAGLFFEGPEADTWLQTGLDILTDEIPEQILADGGHFERSTMYHALALEDILDLCNVMRCHASSSAGADSQRIPLTACRQSCERRALEMVQWLKAMQHPDGEISFFNDAAFGVAPSSAELEGYARRLGFSSTTVFTPLVYLHPSGYVRLQSHAAVALIDVAPVGPDYLPGHAHADTLSLELSIGQQRVIVNGGTSVYGTGPERHRQRCTSSHSTLVVDNENSSEVWAGFRVARRARVLECEMGSDELLWVRAAHDGYARLPGRPIHQREWRLSEDKLAVHDSVTGSGSHSIEVFFHLGPGLIPRKDADGNVQLIDEQRGLRVASLLASEPSSLCFAQTSWHPFFGKAVPTWSVIVQTQRSLPFEHQTVFEWN
jgi:uncharacterized heparinase superfamily protein